VISSGTTTVVVGRIARANDRGVLLDGEDEWRNVSKFADGCADPQQFDGGDVSLTLDGQGYIRAITEAAPAPVPPAPVATAEPAVPAVPVPAEPLSKDTMIARHVALKAAVELLAADITTDSDPEIAISLAAAFEEWLMRPAS